MNKNKNDEQLISQLARRYQLPRSAVTDLAIAIRNGRGMAQFNHPDLGGMGQWSPGMTMIGEMSNHVLKAKIEDICSELSQGLSEDTIGKDISSASAGEADKWYPSGLGSPSCVGDQNGLRYAAFPASRRLVIVHDGDIRIYDTGKHIISGVSQAQGPEPTLTFTSQLGSVRIIDLPIM